MTYKLAQHLTCFISCLLIGTSLTLTAQTSILSTKSQPIDEDRYDDIKGSPYLFKTPIKANLIDKNGELIKDILINYNGFDHGIEVYKNERFTLLDEKHYPKIIIKNHGIKNNVDGDMILVPSLQSSTVKGIYFQEIHSTQDVSLYKKFRIAKKETETNVPGETITLRRFSKYYDYFIHKDGELQQVKNKRDDFIKVLGHEKEIKNFCKKTKNKLKTDQDLKELIIFYDTL